MAHWQCMLSILAVLHPSAAYVTVLQSGQLPDPPTFRLTKDVGGARNASLVGVGRVAFNIDSFLPPHCLSFSDYWQGSVRLTRNTKIQAVTCRENADKVMVESPLYTLHVNITVPAPTIRLRPASTSSFVPAAAGQVPVIRGSAVVDVMLAGVGNDLRLEITRDGEKVAWSRLPAMLSTPGRYEVTCFADHSRMIRSAVVSQIFFISEDTAPPTLLPPYAALDYAEITIADKQGYSIHFAINDTATHASPLYTGPFMIMRHGASRVEAMAVKNDGSSVSAVATATYTVAGKIADVAETPSKRTTNASNITSALAASIAQLDTWPVTFPSSDWQLK